MRHRSLISCILQALLLCCGAGVASGADSLQGLFNQGNAYYQSGDFAAAERCYRMLPDQGVDSGTVYYNLGNACFKQKKLGEAIFYWEKARRLLPGDPEVRENLQLANLLIVDRIPVPEDPLPFRLLSAGVHLLTIEQESRTVLFLFILANALFSIYLLVRRPRIAFRALTASVATALVALLFGASLAWKVYEQNHNLQGVIIEQKTDVRSGPGMENITVVTVHEGVVVRVRAESNGWYQISLPNGWNGWLPGNSVRLL
jgi:tetratricopeptide (TPR) repeat protein